MKMTQRILEHLNVALSYDDESADDAAYDVVRANNVVDDVTHGKLRALAP